MSAIRAGLLSVVLAMACLATATAQSDDPFIIHPRAEWKYHAQQAPPTADWASLDFNADHWPSGAPGFGYGDDDDATVLTDMENNYQSIQIRRELVLESVPRNIFLYVNYDDAFILYVNGERVRSRGIKGEVIESHEAEGFEIYKLKRDRFVEGRNVIAIEGFNASLDSSDFSLWPFLATSRKALN